MAKIVGENEEKALGEWNYELFSYFPFFIISLFSFFKVFQPPTLENEKGSSSLSMVIKKKEASWRRFKWKKTKKKIFCFFLKHEATPFHFVSFYFFLFVETHLRPCFFFIIWKVWISTQKKRNKKESLFEKSKLNHEVISFLSFFPFHFFFF